MFIYVCEYDACGGRRDDRKGRAVCQVDNFATKYGQTWFGLGLSSSCTHTTDTFFPCFYMLINILCWLFLGILNADIVLEARNLTFSEGF